MLDRDISSEFVPNPEQASIPDVSGFVTRLWNVAVNVCLDECLI